MSPTGQNEPNFATEMERLAKQAETSSGEKSAAPSSSQRSALADLEDSAALYGLMRPLSRQLDQLREHVESEFGRFSRLLEAKSQEPVSVDTSSMDRLEKLVEKKLHIESANQKLFDRLHAELKEYRDNFIFDALHRPLIKDLIAFHDDLDNLKQQIHGAGHGAAPEALEATLQTIRVNISHLQDFLMEIFRRLDVEDYETEGDRLDLQHHKAVRQEAAATAEEDNFVTARLRRGFRWRGKVLRPEEVVIKKWRPENAGPPPSD